MPRIALLTSPGLAQITYRELEHLDLQVKQLKTIFLRNHDLILGEVDSKSVNRLRKLRTVEDLFIVLTEIGAVRTESDLKRIAPKSLRTNLLSSLVYLPGKKKRSPLTSFAIFVKQDRDHEVFRKDIAKTIADSIENAFAKWRHREPADVELWCFYTEDLLITGLRITSIEFRQRTYRSEERPGALRPTIAAAMVLLSAPVAYDIFLDPMCGSGTILFERTDFGGSKSLIGNDSDSKALTIAAETAKRFKDAIEFQNVDATNATFLEGQEGQVTKVVTNLPFGKQFKKESELASLYGNALGRWATLLAPTGRMVLLTPHIDMLITAAKKNGLRVQEKFPIRVKGTRCFMTVLAG